MPKTQRERAIAWALQSENEPHVRRMLTLAKGLPGLTDDGDGWDEVPHKLGCANGVINLRTGRLEPGVREDKISRTTRVAYDEGAAAPRWGQFLREVFVTDALVDYIQLAVGYSFTGLTSEQCFFFCHGGGANGKTTFIGALRHAAGDYGYTLPFAVLEPSRNIGEGASPYMADLDGPRFVTASEVRENTRLDESRIKTLSGEDDVSARRLHSAPFTFRPQLKLWIAANHKPQVSDDSEGFWRKARYVPFTERFDGDAADSRLSGKLLLETPGILRWVVEGAARWYAAVDANDGRPVLGEVPGAAEMLKEWRTESDPIEEWLGEKCIERNDCRVEVGAAFESYDDWCDSNRIKLRDRIPRKSFSRRLSERFGKTKTMGKRYILGIGLETDYPDSVF